jgi:AraC family transcriptional regulator, transcriptional activator of the genes for pyochelin and ferripyochelin receptors
MVAQHSCWGTLDIKQLATEHVLVNYYTGKLNEDLNISFEDKHLADVVNVCISLEGRTAAYSKNQNISLPLSANHYHHVAINDNAYDLRVTPNFQDVHIQFDQHYFKRLLCDENPWMCALKVQLERKEGVLKGNGSVTYEMLRIIGDLFNNPLTGQLKKIYTEAKVLELLATQFKQLSEIPLQHSPLTAERDLFMAIHEYLQQHFAEDLSLASIAKQFGINEFKLKKGYKENFNSTVFDHVLELRMKKAYQLLQEGNCFVHEVSRDIGYKSANHFTTAFKKRFGKSPSAL